MELVDLEAARVFPGLRLVILAGAPSPWSQAAKALAELEVVEAVAVRLRPKDDDVRAWTGAPNAPVAMYRAEPPRTGWADILALIERLAPRPHLVPAEAEARVRMFGLAHELMGEGGLCWSARLMMVEASLASEGREGFPLPAAQHLAARYGHTLGCASAARARVAEVLGLLDAALSRGGPYLLGPALSALDVYAACTLNMVVPLADADCPLHPKVRGGFEWLRGQLVDTVPRALIEHRARMYRDHLRLPLVM